MMTGETPIRPQFLLFRNKQPPVTIPEFQNIAVPLLKSIYSLYVHQILININLYGKKGHPRDTTAQTYKKTYDKKRCEYGQRKQKPTLQNKNWDVNKSLWQPATWERVASDKQIKMGQMYKIYCAAATYVFSGLHISLFLTV